MLQQFLNVFRIIPNPNTVSEKSPAELIFVRKIKSIFNKLPLDRRARTSRNNSNISKYFESGVFKVYKRGKKFWEDGAINKRTGKMTNMVQGQRL